MTSCRWWNENKKQYTNHKQLYQEEEEKQIQDQENISSNNDSNFNKNINNQYINYDERPIGKKKIDYNSMFAEGQNFEGDGFGGLNQETNPNPNQKKIIKKKILQERSLCMMLEKPLKRQN